jgi:hypothetical protein
VKQAVRQLAPEARLERRVQIELAAVVETVVSAAEGYHAVGVVAASQRSRHQVRWVGWPRAA